MTIYHLYADNGNHAGFWIQHRSWRSMCAQVTSIAGLRSGRLPGAAPDHDNAEVIVQFFDVGSGRRVPDGTLLESPEDRGYTMIAQPPWARSAHAPQNKAFA